MWNLSKSQVSQDLFVICALDGKRDGTYFEVGASVPVNNNNTYLLESKFGWRGISFELDGNLVNWFNDVRKNICIRADATNVDFMNIARLSGFGNHFDYLQLDIDPPRNTLKSLKSLDLNKISFSVVTYEHDSYTGGEKERAESREILESHGYTRVLSDVRHDDKAFEDWWVNEKYMRSDNWKNFIGEGIVMNKNNMPPAMKDKLTAMLSEIEAQAAR